MKLFAVKRIAVSLLYLTIAVSTLQAQGKIPSWVKKEPVRKDSYIGIASASKPTPMDTVPFNPNYKEDVQRIALWKVASQLPWNIDQTASLFAVLSGKGLYKCSLNDVLLSEMNKSPLFSDFEEWENETEYWCFYSVKKTAGSEFIEQLVDSTKAKGERMYAEAKELQNQGYLYRAAQKYIETLDSLHPAIFRFLPVANDTGVVDLGNLVYGSYFDVYEDITMTTEVSSMPAVYGEKIPGTYAVTVIQHGNPVRNLSLVPKFDGIITADPATNADGKCFFSIENISSSSTTQMIGFEIDTDLLLDLPPVYGCNPLEDRNQFPTIEILVNLFNPRTYTKIDVADTDSLLKLNLKNIWKNNREDAVVIEGNDSADVVVEYTVNIDKEKPIDTEKYHFIQYNSSLSVKVKGVADDLVLTEYEIKDFKIMLPASRTEAQVRQSALREMTRQLNREFPAKVSDFYFDKREIVWRPLVSLSTEE